MEKLSMCRICLVEDVRMYVVVNKNLHELYEKLTDVPFVTKDHRPMLACFFCCTKLKQCYRFLRKCLEAEKQFTQMLNEDYEQDSLLNTGHLEVFNGFSNSPIELISTVDGGQTESDAIKEELPDVSERLDDTIDPEEEHQTHKSELDDVDKSYPDVEDTTALHAESDSEDMPLSEIKYIGTPVTKKPKLEMRRPKLEDAISAEQMKNENNPELSCVSTIIKKTQNPAYKRPTNFKEPFTKTQYEVNITNNTALGTSGRNNSNKDDNKSKRSDKGIDSEETNRYGGACVNEKRFECDICQHSFSRKDTLIRHIRTHTGEKPFKCDECQRSFSKDCNLTRHIRIHTGEKPFKCDNCQRSFINKGSLLRHTFTHNGQKPFNCETCQKSFNQKIHLASHIRTHTGEKPYKCDICQRSYGKKCDLIRHTSIHTGEKPFKCRICQSRFSQKRSLAGHTRTHTDERPLKCDI